jgi:hypothetical protein
MIVEDSARDRKRSTIRKAWGMPTALRGSLLSLPRFLEELGNDML